MRFIQIANFLFLSAYIFSALTIGTALMMGGIPVSESAKMETVSMEQGPADMIILAQNTQ